MILTIHVKPNAKATKLVSQLDERSFTMALHAPATEGKANEELIEILHERLKVPRTFIVIKRGHNSRVKHIEVPDGTSMDGLRRLL